MNGAVIYAKTRKGLEELTHRTAAVPQKVRSILILVDGKTRCSELLQKCSFISECKEHLEWLERNGLIEAVGTTNAPGAIASDAPPIPSQAPVTISPKKALIQLAQELLGLFQLAARQGYHGPVVQQHGSAYVALRGKGYSFQKQPLCLIEHAAGVCKLAKVT